jgi:hypothetical protein
MICLKCKAWSLIVQQLITLRQDGTTPLLGHTTALMTRNHSIAAIMIPMATALVTAIAYAQITYTLKLRN